jgi:hypothetical protein
MLDTAGAAHRKQTPFAGVLRLGAATPQGIVKAVRFEDYGIGQWLIVGFCLAQVGEQLAPARLAGIVLTDAIQGGSNHAFPSAFSMAARAFVQSDAIGVSPRSQRVVRF